MRKFLKEYWAFMMVGSVLIANIIIQGIERDIHACIAYSTALLWLFVLILKDDFIKRQRKLIDMQNKMIDDQQSIIGFLYLEIKQLRVKKQ